MELTPYTPGNGRAAGAAILNEVRRLIDFAKYARENWENPNDPQWMAEERKAYEAQFDTPSKKRKENPSPDNSKSMSSSTRSVRARGRYRLRKSKGKLTAGYRKSKKSRRLRKKSKYRSRRGGKYSTKSLGQVGVVGGRDEEDKQVKRHMKKGVVIETGTTGSISGAHGGYIVHSTVPQNSMLNAIVLALLKSLVCHMGYEIKDPNDTVYPIGGSSSVNVYITYFLTTGNSQVFSPAVTTGNAGAVTWYALATNLAALLLGLTTTNRQSFIKFGHMFMTDSTVTTKWYGSIDLDVSKLKIDLVSNLVYQNRSSPNDAVANTNALDVAQDPLFEVHVAGKGTGPISKIGGITNSISNFFVDVTLGVIASDSGNNSYLLSEPSAKGYFTNGRRGVNTIHNPGVVKQSKLKSHYMFTLTKLVPYLNDFGNTANNLTKCLLGKYKFLWFRKTIDLSTNAQNYTVAFQHHFAVGVTCLARKDSTTVPYVAVIQ